MRRFVWTFAAVVAAATAGDVAQALIGNRVMTIKTMTFTLPAKLSGRCRKAVMAATTEAEGRATLQECKIPFTRDVYSRLKTRTPPAEWEAALSGAPIGKIAIKTDGDVLTYFIVAQERPLSMASLGDAFPIRRVIYEGQLDTKMQQALGPIHDFDGVVRVLRENGVNFEQDGGSLLPGSVPKDISQLLLDKPGEPVVVQGKDNGVIYARRVPPPQP